jgi:hypothetical protein
MYRLWDMQAAAGFFGVDRRTYIKWEHGHITKALSMEKLNDWIKSNQPLQRS